MATSFYEEIILDKDGQVKCQLCNITIRDNDYLIEDHLHNSDHANLERKRLLMQNGITTTGDKLDGPWHRAVGQRECDICDITFNVRDITEHIGNKHHLTNIAAIKEIIKKDGGFMVLPETITKFGKAVNCMICDCSIKFNMDAIKLHIYSARHKRARSIAVQPFNGIFSMEDDKKYLWCKICQVYFQNYVELILQHVDEDQKHLKEIRKLFLLIKDQNISIEKFLQNPRENLAFCSTCSADISCCLVNLEEHIRGKQHKENVKRSLNS